MVTITKPFPVILSFHPSVLRVRVNNHLRLDILCHLTCGTRDMAMSRDGNYTQHLADTTCTSSTADTALASLFLTCGSAVVYLNSTKEKGKHGNKVCFEVIFPKSWGWLQVSQLCYNHKDVTMEHICTNAL